MKSNIDYIRLYKAVDQNPEVYDLIIEVIDYLKKESQNKHKREIFSKHKNPKIIFTDYGEFKTEKIIKKSLVDKIMTIYFNCGINTYTLHVINHHKLVYSSGHAF